MYTMGGFCCFPLLFVSLGILPGKLASQPVKIMCFFPVTNVWWGAEGAKNQAQDDVNFLPFLEQLMPAREVLSVSVLFILESRVRDVRSLSDYWGFLFDF